MRSVLDSKVLCDNLSIPSNSEIFTVYSADDLSLSVTFSENTSGVKLNFKASTDGENYHEIEGVAMNKGDTFATFLSQPQIYSFDISMAIYFRIELESIESGSVSAFATSFTS